MDRPSNNELSLLKELSLYKLFNVSNIYAKVPYEKSLPRAPKKSGQPSLYHS